MMWQHVWWAVTYKHIYVFKSSFIGNQSKTTDPQNAPKDMKHVAFPWADWSDCWVTAHACVRSSHIMHNISVCVSYSIWIFPTLQNCQAFQII